MLVKDLSFVEQIHNLAHLQGGSDSFASSRQPNSSAASFASGSFHYTEVSTESDGVLTSVVASNIDIIAALKSLQDLGVSISL